MILDEDIQMKLEMATLEISRLKDVLAQHGVSFCCFCGAYEKPKKSLDDRGEMDRDSKGNHFHGHCYAKNQKEKKT